MTQIHDSNTCTCEMCRFAGEFEKSRSELPSEASGLEKGQDEFLEGGGENVSQGDYGAGMAISANCSPSTFEHDWNHAPRSRRLRTEQEDALFWYTAGARAREAGLLELFNSDLREILRIAKERIEV